MKRRTTTGLALLAGGLVVGALCAPQAAAGDWKPANDALDLLSPAYRSAEGHTASVSATCSGPDAIEVGVHPWDAVARNLQVYAGDGSMLVNITSGLEFVVVPREDNPEVIVYNGDVRFTIVASRCDTPTSTTLPAPVPTTVPPPTTTSTAPAPTTTVPVLTTTPVTKSDPADESLGLAADVAVAGVSVTLPPLDGLPATGGPEGLLLAVGLLAVAVPTTIVTEHHLRKAKR